MSHLMRAQLGFHVEVASPSFRELPQSPQGRLRHQRPRSAGYDCVINATVRYGRVWLPKQHHRLESPRSRGVGTPRVCRPAYYLPSGTVGQWERRHRAMVERTKGRRPKNRPSDTKGRRPKKPTSVRRNSRSNLGARGGDPRTLASWRH